MVQESIPTQSSGASTELDETKGIQHRQAALHGASLQSSQIDSSGVQICTELHTDPPSCWLPTAMQSRKAFQCKHVQHGGTKSLNAWQVTFRSNRVCRVKAGPSGSTTPSSCCNLVQWRSFMTGLRRAAATGTTSCHLATLSHSTGVTCTP